MSPFRKDETCHASPVGTILPFTLHITGSMCSMCSMRGGIIFLNRGPLLKVHHGQCPTSLIPHGDIHTLLGYEPFLLLLLLSL